MLTTGDHVADAGGVAGMEVDRIPMLSDDRESPDRQTPRHQRGPQPASVAVPSRPNCASHALGATEGMGADGDRDERFDCLADNGFQGLRNWAGGPVTP